MSLAFERLSGRFVISCFGRDASSFLQGLITNDIRQQSFYSAMLSSRGKYLFDFFVYQEPGKGYLLDCGDHGLLEKLSFCVISADVRIADLSSEFGVVYSREPLELSRCMKDPRYNRMGFRSLLPAESHLKGAEFIGLYKRDKYEFAIPDGGTDMIAEKSFPAEFGISYLNGISYAKGCYVGQELMARFQGRDTARRVYKVISAESLESVPRGSTIFCNKKEVGVLCSADGNLGIGLSRSAEGNCTVAGLQVRMSPAPWYEGQ